MPIVFRTWSTAYSGLRDFSGTPFGEDCRLVGGVYTLPGGPGFWVGQCFGAIRRAEFLSVKSVSFFLRPRLTL